MVGIWLVRACKAQFHVTAPGMEWGCPDEAAEAERNSQIWSDVHIDHSWGYYSRKLAAAEAPPGTKPTALYERP